MKTAEKSSNNSLIQRSQHPFFSKRGDDSFFAPSGTPIQAKIEIGQANDPYEKEADAMAEQVVQKKEVEPNQKDKQKLQTKPLSESITPIVQKKRSEEEEQTAPQGFESQLNSSKGGGSPMSESVKSDMESGFGHDFSNVRLHTNSNAVQMSKDLNAQAFTHGNDVYFNENKYNPNSTDGKKLLAHELTHTVQQGGEVKKKMVQKAGEPTPPEIYSGTEGKVIKDGNTYKLELNKLELPRFKTGADFTPKPLSFNYPSPREDTQRTIWEAQMRPEVPKIADIVKKKIDGFTNPPKIVQVAGKPQAYALKKKKGDAGKKRDLIIGTPASIANRMVFPNWSPTGDEANFDADHKQEMQLGGPNIFKNLWLLHAGSNRSSGSSIDKSLTKAVSGLISAAKKSTTEAIPTPDSSKRMPLIVKDFIPSDKGKQEAENSYKPDQITEDNTKHPVNGLEPLSEEEIKKMGFGRPDVLMVFSNIAGGIPHKIEGFKPNQPMKLPVGGNVKEATLTYQDGIGGQVNAKIFGKPKKHIPEKDATFKLVPMEGVPMSAYVPSGSELIKGIGGLQFDLFSPVELNTAEFDFDKGIIAKAIIHTDVPFLDKGSPIALTIDGDEIYLEKTFTGGDIKIPKPFKITNCDLTIKVGTVVGFEGGVDFEIEKVGKGSVHGGVLNGKFSVEGEFNFDSKLFDPAKVSVSYIDKELTVSGQIGIKKDKVKGIKKANATVNYSQGVLTADGNAELDVKGLDKGTMNLRYDGKELTIGGSFQLSKDIPRIKSGSVAASVTAKEGGEYAISASGTAQPDIPGIDSSIAISYNDGALTVEGSVNYEKGIAKGSVKMGATNRAVGPDGIPSGKPGDKWTIYGEGSLTLKLTPWLQATAGVKFSPAGELSVSGKIGLPGAVNVFERKDFNKNLFHFPTLEIPLLAIPVGPRSIGLVATIGGGVDFNAGFGPGKLEELFAEVNYTVGQEDSLSLHGRGKFVIPADATIRIFGRAGIGLSIGIARVSGNIELGAAVGIKGAAEAEVDVNWDPKNGISLQAVGRIYVEPVLKFDVNLVLEAVLDLYFYEFRKEWKKNLAQKEFGSGMRFGLEFPVNYKEGEPFNISADDIKVIKPDLDISSIVSRFKDELF